MSGSPDTPVSDDRSGWIGVIPGRIGMVGEGLSDEVIQRWDRWYELARRASGAPLLVPDRPNWRLAARAGVFCPEPVTGVWRLSHDRAGRIYPFAVLRAGALPAPQDRWFDTAARIVEDATEGVAMLAEIARSVTRLPRPATAAVELDGAVVLWRDDWEVHELTFATPRDFAAYGLPRWAPEGGEAPA